MGACTAFIFAALIEFTLTNYLWRKGRKSSLIRRMENEDAASRKDDGDGDGGRELEAMLAARGNEDDEAAAADSKNVAIFDREFSRASGGANGSLRGTEAVRRGMINEAPLACNNNGDPITRTTFRIPISILTRLSHRLKLPVPL